MKLRIATRQNLRDAGLCAGFIAVAIALGGASRAGFVANAVVQIAAFAIIALTILRGAPADRTRSQTWLFGLVLGMIGLQFLQLIPLPFALWSSLPGRDVVVEGFRIAGIGTPAMPLSLNPDQTLRAFLGVVPALAMVMLVQSSDRAAVFGGISAVLALAAVSAILGLMQIVGGQDSAPYLYEVTNRGNAVGLFANSNHLATLMVASIPLAFGLAGWLRTRGKTFRKSPLEFITLAAFVPLAAFGVVMSGSLAGILLLALVIAASTLILMGDLAMRTRLIIVGGAAALILAAVAVGVLSPGIKDFGYTDMAAGGLSRPYMWSVTGEAIRATLPFGSGFGSFEQVFHLFENRSQVHATFANHAHNDLLEFTLEAGVPGLLLLGLFLLWFAQRLWALWIKPPRPAPLARGASIAVLAILLHSLVDYPLRTAAIAAVFGLCCALMARPGGVTVRAKASSDVTSARHLSV